MGRAGGIPHAEPPCARPPPLLAPQPLLLAPRAEDPQRAVPPLAARGRHCSERRRGLPPPSPRRGAAWRPPRRGLPAAAARLRGRGGGGGRAAPAPASLGEAGPERALGPIRTRRFQEAPSAPRSAPCGAALRAGGPGGARAAGSGRGATCADVRRCARSDGQRSAPGAVPRCRALPAGASPVPSYKERFWVGDAEQLAVPARWFRAAGLLQAHAHGESPRPFPAGRRNVAASELRRCCQAGRWGVPPGPRDSRIVPHPKPQVGLCRPSRSTPIHTAVLQAPGSGRARQRSEPTQRRAEGWVLHGGWRQPRPEAIKHQE